MPVLNPNDLTFSPDEVRSTSAAVFKKAYKNPAFTEFHAIEQGIKAGKQIALLGRMGLLGKKKTGCAPSESSSGITNTEKFWQPVVIEDRVGDCWENIKETFFVWGTKNGIAREDLTDTDFANFVEMRISEALNDTNWRNAWFGDTAANNVGASPNPGNLTVGVDPDYFNALDGYWKQLFAIVATTSERKSTGLASRNGQSTYADQKFTTTDTTNRVVMETLASMKNDSTLLLKDQPNRVYIVTLSVFEQYARELRSYTNVEASYNRIESGYNVLMFENIPVIPVSFFDRTIQDYFDNGSSYYLPHRAVLTTTDNLKLGLEATSNLDELDVFYDKTLKKIFMDFAVSMDAKVIDDELVQVAY